MATRGALIRNMHVLFLLTVAITAAAQAPTPTSQLAKIHRIYVESFGDDAASRQIQAMIVDSLTRSGSVVITENKERADAILKGVATEQVHQETHATSEGTSIGQAAGGASVNGGHFRSNGAGLNDSELSTNTVTDASVSIRLVTPDGDVIWSCAKESHGAKYKGPAADVADQVAKQLIRDTGRTPGQ